METEGNGMGTNIHTNIPNVVQLLSYTNANHWDKKVNNQKTYENVAKTHN